MSLKKEILKHIPQQNPFRFVNEFIEVSPDVAKGCYTFPKDAFFYKGHFPDNPITPGVILTETMVQIGLLGIGICIAIGNNKKSDFSNVVLVATDIEFLKPVYPEEKVIVTAEKIYFRFGKLKCKVKMLNVDGVTVCKGEVAGMLLYNK